MTIAQLNQKVDVLQAQLSGSQRRASEMNTQISELQNILAERNAEIESLKQNAERYESALDRMGKDVHELQAEKMAAMAKKEPAHGDPIAEQNLR